ncbi:MAG: endonuclease/exonuclease/phosphatase family protein, partial [Muribaculaceae bacterium]|nr:endonuclease/exonuclease/phosphatase family protein [Muribaculaceae bacterium]
LSHFDGTTHPAILAGDFNAPPHDPTIQQLLAQWTDCTPADQPTFSTSKPSEKIDYILTRPTPSCPAGTATSSWRIVESHVIHTILSDHFAVIATLVLTHP